MADTLHSPELDKLLDKFQRGGGLTKAELAYVKDQLWQIITAGEAEGVSKGEQALAGDIYASLSVRGERKEAHA